MFHSCRITPTVEVGQTLTDLAIIDGEDFEIRIADNEVIEIRRWGTYEPWEPYDPDKVLPEPEPEKELEELKVYAAQLSALDLGSKIDFQAIKSGGKYPQRHVGYLTEVKHNHVDGYTAVRVWPSRISESKTTIESSIRNKFGIQHTIPYATEVVVLEEPPQ